MALNNFKSNHLMPLHFKGLSRALYVGARLFVLLKTDAVMSWVSMLHMVKYFLAWCYMTPNT